MKIFIQFEHEKGSKCGKRMENENSHNFSISHPFILCLNEKWGLLYGKVKNVKCEMLLPYRFLKFHEQRRVTMKFHIKKMPKFFTLLKIKIIMKFTMEFKKVSHLLVVCLLLSKSLKFSLEKTSENSERTDDEQNLYKDSSPAVSIKLPRLLGNWQKRKVCSCSREDYSRRDDEVRKLFDFIIDLLCPSSWESPTATHQHQQPVKSRHGTVERAKRIDDDEQKIKVCILPQQQRS